MCVWVGICVCGWPIFLCVCMCVCIVCVDACMCKHMCGCTHVCVRVQTKVPLVRWFTGLNNSV
jgi:hypothetical protein